MVDESEAAAATPVKYQFHYIKAPDYREVPCHGAIGSLTAQGKLWIAFYAERYPLPRIVEYEVPAPDPGATVVRLNERESTPIYVDTRQGVIRHVEFSAYLDIEAARRIRDWLTQHIAESEATASAAAPASTAPASPRRARRTEKGK